MTLMPPGQPHRRADGGAGHELTWKVFPRAGRPPAIVHTKRPRGDVPPRGQLFRRAPSHAYPEHSYDAAGADPVPHAQVPIWEGLEATSEIRKLLPIFKV